MISDGLAYPDLFEALLVAERQLARPINPTILTGEEWRQRREQSDSFVARIAAQRKLFVLGSEHDLD